MRAKEAGGEVGKKAAEALVGMFPGGGTAMSIFSGVKDGAGLLKKLYGADDETKTGTGLDKLNVDDDVSKIVDDPVEVGYLNYLIKDKFADEIISKEDKWSSLDKSYYRVRFKYIKKSRKPSKSTRTFCKNMMRLSKAGFVYRIEDIDAASRAGVNKQLGHKGRP